MASSALHRLAEDPELFTEPPDGADRIVDDRACVVIGPKRRWAGVCRLRLDDDPQAISEAVEAIAGVASGIESVVWNVGSSATPGGLHERLRVIGLRDPDPPFDPRVAAMVLESEPAVTAGPDVRRIETLEDHLAGLEIMLASARFTEARAADERARAVETFERRGRRGALQWLGLLDGEPVAYAAADRAEAGLFLAGGATLPSARGRGCYRALVRARWDEAVRLGRPGLAVQAQYGSSAPILRRLGFEEIATVHTLQSRGAEPGSTDRGRDPG